MKYRVYFEGFAVVEADSPEEAKENYMIDPLYGEQEATKVRPLDIIEDDGLWDL